MSEETEATQGLPDGEAVESTAIDQAPETVTEQTPDEQQEPEPEKPKHKPWFQERIDQLTRDKYAARERAEALEARLAEMLTDPEKAKAPSPVNIDEEVNKRLAARQFDDKCNEVYSSGKSEFKDFDETLSNFQMLGGLPAPLLQAVTQLPDAHKVLYTLGQNMDDAARILSLPPVPMAMELARLSMSPVKAKPVSNAPPPIPTIDGTPRGSKSPDDMSTEEWIKWREAQVKS